MPTEAFIRRHTKALPVAGLEPITLYQASELTPLWQMTEADMSDVRLAPPFWAFAWAGGQGIARYLRDHPQTVTGKRVFDLACGSGLVAIAAMLAGARSAVANDIDPLCKAAVALNAALNGVNVDYDARDYLDTAPEGIDVILAGDICYERAMSERLLAFLSRAHSQGIAVYIGDPGRSYFPKTGLKRLGGYDILTTTEIEDSPQKHTTVWQMI
jgi:predicted nicotinamide N-methyase